MSSNPELVDQPQLDERVHQLGAGVGEGQCLCRITRGVGVSLRVFHAEVKAAEQDAAEA